MSLGKSALYYTCRLFFAIWSGKLFKFGSKNRYKIYLKLVYASDEQSFGLSDPRPRQKWVIDNDWKQ